ncbi:amidohydrolase family protein [Emergencia timonensis]
MEVGKQANFVILSGDVFTVPENEIKEIKVLETYIDGDCKYKA